MNSENEQSTQNVAATASDTKPAIPPPTNGGASDPPAAPGEGEPKPKRRRGFAAMDPRLVSELATRGGKAAHRAGTAHEFTSEEARIAGRKGGMATHAKRRAKMGGAPPVVS
jgi:general stress protein YciG